MTRASQCAPQGRTESLTPVRLDVTGLITGQLSKILRLGWMLVPYWTLAAFWLPRSLVYVTFRHVTCTLEQINRENRGSNPEYVIFPEGNGVAKFRIISKRNGVSTDFSSLMDSGNVTFHQGAWFSY